MPPLPTDTPPPAPSILVVDDTPANLQLLASMLKGHGYRVRPINSGEQALRAVETQVPDLILLDITMPDMDGYEVCRRLKGNELWRDIPVLFISALNSTEDKVRAFTAGGVDYVSKPFQFEEVEARVRTHLQLRQQQQKLQDNLIRMHEMEILRDNLVHMVVHDMRSPLMVVQMTLEFLETLPGGRPHAEAEMLSTAHQGIRQLGEMASQILDINRMEGGQMQLDRRIFDLAAIGREVVDSLRPLAATKTLTVVPAGPVPAFGDVDIVRRMIANLITNALKFTPESGSVAVTALGEAGTARIFVRDSGPGIDPALHARIFDKYAQIEGPARKAGAGLGLTFVKMAAEAHGGRVILDSAPGKGSTFGLVLPAAPGT